MYELLAGEKPFAIVWDLFGDGDVDEYGEMKDMDLPADLSRLRGVSDEGVALIGRMTTKEFQPRPTAEQVSYDPWFAKCAAAGSYFSPRVEGGEAAKALSDAELDARAARMVERSHMSFFAKALLNTMAGRLASETLHREKSLFMQVDGVQAVEDAGAAVATSGGKNGSTTHDGELTVAELRGLFATRPELAKNQSRLDAVVRALDVDGDGKLSFNEWVAATMDICPASSTQAADAVLSLFETLDQSGDGLLQLSELRDHFGHLSPEHEEALKAFFQKLDTDGDGAISLAEFKAFWTRGGASGRPAGATSVPSFIESKFTSKVEYEAWKLTLVK